MLSSRICLITTRQWRTAPADARRLAPRVAAPLAALRWLALAGLTLALLTSCALGGARRGGTATASTTPPTPTSAPPIPTLLVNTLTTGSQQATYDSAISPSNGQLRWSEAETSASSKVVGGDGALYVTQLNTANQGVQASPYASTSAHTQTDQNGETLQAVRLSDKTTLWSVPLTNQFIPFAEQNGVLYTFALSQNPQLAFSNSLVVAFKATNGAQLWATPLTQTVTQTPVFSQGVLAILTTPFNGAGVSGTYTASGLRPSDGHILWTTALPTAVRAIFQMTPDAGSLYIIAGPPNVSNPLDAVETTQIVALDLATGRDEWNHSYDNVISHVAVAITNYTICLALALPNGIQAVTAMSDKDGATLWTQDVSDTIEALSAGPSAVYVDTLGNTLQSQLSAYALLSGSPLWNTILANQYVPRTFIADGVIYIATVNDFAADSSTLDARNATGGALLWRLSIKGGVFSMALTE